MPGGEITLHIIELSRVFFQMLTACMNDAIFIRHVKIPIQKNYMLVCVLQAWQEERNKSGFVGTIQMDLS